MTESRTNDKATAEAMAALARVREIDKKWGVSHGNYEHLSTELVGVEDWEIELEE